MAAERATERVIERGHPGAGHNRSGGGEAGPATDDVRLQQVVRRYEQLGDTPPEFNIALNDEAHAGGGAHTVAKHGPQLPLPREPGVQTVEGRIYGETGWGKEASKSYRWTDAGTMNREVNRYVRENWPAIRNDLAFDEFHEGLSDAGHRIGQGYYNKGMFGAGPREAEYGETSLFRVRIRVVAGTDPAVPFIVTAFPAGLG
ncbi:hypothetical protein [Paractinoplanes hotanensis]|uniref:Bacterial CdiA-CT RNAse A domain-containing protein n=1 Tax=Paractinoplanes hotanensis TaxID=2906497 RepID=A0ABT0Y3L9_9ACTN|nr:hypothetical protein [Actinoplanes hotanensis]MCM4080435.1 hypothetical protein [Actinoplanes hotanensis]